MKIYHYFTLPFRDHVPGIVSNFFGEDEEGKIQAKEAAFNLAHELLEEGWDYVSIHKVTRES